ncbi:uncharacterized protein LOC133791920 [Humulus lupulus]|uniref:uncharacterized protein LOC133791920 n=1 Tax=Humulus lupulus TaxID=3486 RepID=UPI002B410171|nr:uncharacterized protein LOC133791920 [Humulus lupulus]
MNFLHKNIFTGFGTPQALISDEGSHFYNKKLDALLVRYGVYHHTALPYHSQSNGQAEFSNKEVKSILEKMAMKKPNFDEKATKQNRLLQLNELDEFRNEAYENAKIYKGCTKAWLDKNLIRKEFQPGQ